MDTQDQDTGYAIDVLRGMKDNPLSEADRSAVAAALDVQADGLPSEVFVTAARPRDSAPSVETEVTHQDDVGLTIRQGRLSVLLDLSFELPADDAEVLARRVGGDRVTVAAEDEPGAGENVEVAIDGVELELELEIREDIGNTTLESSFLVYDQQENPHEFYMRT